MAGETTASVLGSSPLIGLRGVPVSFFRLIYFMTAAPNRKLEPNPTTRLMITTSLVLDVDCQCEATTRQWGRPPSPCTTLERGPILQPFFAPSRIEDPAARHSVASRLERPLAPFRRRAAERPRGWEWLPVVMQLREALQLAPNPGLDDGGHARRPGLVLGEPRRRAAQLGDRVESDVEAVPLPHPSNNAGGRANPPTFLCPGANEGLGRLADRRSGELDLREPSSPPLPGDPGGDGAGGLIGASLHGC